MPRHLMSSQKVPSLHKVQNLLVKDDLKIYSRSERK